jgi:hypothetical protein
MSEVRTKWKSVCYQSKSTADEVSGIVCISTVLHTCSLADLRDRNSNPKSSGSSQPSLATTDQDFAIVLPAVSASNSSEDYESLIDYHQKMFQDGNIGRQKIPSDQASAPTSLLPQRKVDRKKAEDLLSAFKKKAHYFPFISLPPNASIQSLSKTSPFLFLAILAAASISDTALHRQIDYEFRKVLSSKVIVEGQKSLDYLQGILVYLAWYVCWDPKYISLIEYTGIQCM